MNEMERHIKYNKDIEKLANEFRNTTAFTRGHPNVKGTTEQNMCGAKTRHLTEKSARQEKQSIYDKSKDVVNVYQCPFCHYYHVGRNRVKD